MSLQRNTWWILMNYEVLVCSSPDPFCQFVPCFEVIVLGGWNEGGRKERQLLVPSKVEPVCKLRQNLVEIPLLGIVTIGSLGPKSSPGIHVALESPWTLQLVIWIVEFPIAARITDCWMWKDQHITSLIVRTKENITWMTVKFDLGRGACQILLVEITSLFQMKDGFFLPSKG